MKENKVIIIGAGPAGLFAARSILEYSSHAEVLILEQGMSIENRECTARRDCFGCHKCSVICGAGGAGMYSDGKLILDLSSGGNLEIIEKLDERNKGILCNYIKDTLIQYDGVSEYKGIPEESEQNELKKQIARYGLGMKLYPVLHMGTNNLKKIITNFLLDLVKTYPDRFRVLYGKEVRNIKKGGMGYIVEVQNEEGYHCRYVVIGVGKTGACWSKRVLERLGCHFMRNPFYFGLRIETRTSVLNPLLRYSFDPKIYKMYDDGSKVKMHCVCREGDIRPYNSNGYLLVGGHTYYTKENHCEKKSDRCNFNILMSFDPDKISYQEILNAFKRISDRKVLVQRLGDFRRNRVPENSDKELTANIMSQVCNIREIVDGFQEFPEKLLDFIQALDFICPGLNDDNNLLYGPTMEWTMDKIELKDGLETEADNIFAIGDGAGVSQGIVYSAATGIIAAKEISKRIE